MPDNIKITFAYYDPTVEKAPFTHIDLKTVEIPKKIYPESRYDGGTKRYLFLHRLAFYNGYRMRFYSGIEPDILVMVNNPGYAIDPIDLPKSERQALLRRNPARSNRHD